MGKPYAQEIVDLQATYAWSRKTTIDDAAVSGVPTSLPLLAVGSGGSLTVAHFACALHQQHTRQIAKAITPLDVVEMAPQMRDSAVMFFSAGGSNPDIMGAFRKVVSCEPGRLAVCSLRKQSRLNDLARRYGLVDLLEFSPPSKKDGFLATNSLLAFCVLLMRLYSKSAGDEMVLPRSLRLLLHPKRTEAGYTRWLHDICRPLWERQQLILLHGPTTAPAAIDLESKFTEAALGPVQISDFRNFGHGRHHWLAKRGKESAVLAIITERDLKLAQRTLVHIPKDIPVAQIHVPGDGAVSCLAALITCLRITQFAGEARGIDPGRPGVPSFGRKLYHLNAFSRKKKTTGITSSQAIAIKRKSRQDIEALQTHEILDTWINAYREFLKKIRRARFHGVVLDYDGTLCSSADRFSGWREDEAFQVVRLLKAGLIVGIATGRGGSAKEDLRRWIPRSLWKSIIVGYHNGAEVESLSVNTSTSTKRLSGPMQQVVDIVKSHPILKVAAKATFRNQQITLRPSAYRFNIDLFDIVKDVIASVGLDEVTVVRSSHSVDILGSGVSKLAVVNHIKGMIGEAQANILCVGDQGLWPGNDFELLSQEYSLSVNEVSYDPGTCWNLSPAGCRGVPSTTIYLESLHIASGTGTARLRLRGH